MKRAAGAVALIALLVLGACSSADDAQQVSDDPAPEATPESQQRAAEAASELLKNFREGPDLPEGWPAGIVLLPEGTTPVASLANSALPGYGQASAVFYSSGQNGDEVADFFERELPAAGWTVLDRVDQNGYSEVSVQGHGYLGIFGAGEVPSRPELRSGELIDLQVVLAELSG